VWNASSGGRARALKPASGWLLEPRGYILLAACRASEYAYEYPFDGNESNGALTYWLLDALKQLGPGLTYKHVHDSILAKIHTQFEQQTPQLQGEGNRVVFGTEHIVPLYAVNVNQVDSENHRLLLNTGQAAGVTSGAQFAIYPPGTSDFTAVEKRLALAEVVEPGAVQSWAEIKSMLRTDSIVQGAQAILLDPGSIRLRRTVRLVRPEDGSEATDFAPALEAVEDAFKRTTGSFVRLAEDGEPADFQVAVEVAAGKGRYVVWDSAGVAIPNLHIPIGSDSKDAPARVVSRLVHLSRYRNVMELDNRDPMSPLARKLKVELLGKQASFDPILPLEPQPFDDPGGTPALTVGEWAIIRIRNESPHILNITVLDLQPDWGITQIYPGGLGFYEPMDPGQELQLPLQASLADEYMRGTDVIKVFATIDATNFRWLELPPLDSPFRRSSTTLKGPTNPLEHLLSAIITEEPGTRNLIPAAYPSRGWVISQVELRVRR
jgi:hypothetical protein